MVKKLLYNGLAVLVLLSTIALAGCVYENIDEPALEQNGDTYITLQFQAATDTRATTVGLTDKELNIENIELFFYTINATETTPATFVCHTEKWQAVEGKRKEFALTVKIPKDTAKTLFGTDNKCRVYAVVNSAEASKIVDDTATGESAPTIAEMREWKVATTEFSKKEQFEKFIMFSTSPNGNEVSLAADGKTATGEVHVSVLAAKIDLFLNVAGEIAGADGKTYVSYLNGKSSHVYIVNGTQAVRLGGWNGNDFLSEEDYYDLRVTGVAHNFADSPTKDDGYPYVTEHAFYSYPNEWTTSIQEQHRTTLILKVDWLPKDGDVEEELLSTYYMVPINLTGDEANKIESGKYYRIKVNINTLGGLNMDEPLTLEDCSCEVLEWSDVKLDSDVRDMRYLEVTQTVTDRDGKVYTAIMNNVEEITIPYNSSHKAIIESVEITYYSYEDFTSSNDSGNGGRDMQVLNAGIFHREQPTPTLFTFESPDVMKDNPTYQGAYFDDANQTITIRHLLGETLLQPNMLGARQYYWMPDRSRYQYNAYDIKIVLNHEDYDGNFDLSTITIKQYPAVYIEGEVNTNINVTFNAGGEIINGYPEDDRYWQAAFPAAWFLYGWVRVNSDHHNGDRALGGIKGIAKSDYGSAEIRNPNTNNPIMYIVNVTQLEPGSRYHIADPRVNNIDNNLSGETIFGVERTDCPWFYEPKTRNIYDIAAGRLNPVALRWYYPTNESLAEENAYALSPQFRVASSFGVQDVNIGREAARRRCAAYQEYGYPAGRWRMPTLGELQYIMMLSRQGAIPKLFNENQVYFTAQGGYTFDSEGTPRLDNADGAVRCVYDEWYWKDEPHLTNTNSMYTYGFIVGDKERNNPQEQPTAEQTEP